MKTYFVIYENPSEFTSSQPVRIAESLEEAESHIMEYSDWYCPKGTCQIREVDEQFRVIEKRTYHDGKLVEVKREKYGRR